MDDLYQKNWRMQRLTPLKLFLACFFPIKMYHKFEVGLLKKS